MDPTTYWRIRYLFSEVERVKLDAQWAVARALERAYEHMRAAGLDPAIPYAFDDATATCIAQRTDDDGATTP